MSKKEDVVLVSDSDSDDEAPKSKKPRKPSPTNGNLCSYALHGLERDEDEEEEEGELKPEEEETPTVEASRGQGEGDTEVVDLSGNGDSVPSTSTAQAASSQEGVPGPYFAKPKLVTLRRLADPALNLENLEEGELLADPPAGHAAKGDEDSMMDESSDMELKDEEGGKVAPPAARPRSSDAGGQSNGAGTAEASVPVTEAAAQKAEKLSTFAKRLLVKRTGPRVAEPLPDIEPLNDYLLQSFADEHVPRGPSEESDAESEVEVVDVIKPLKLLGGRPRSGEEDDDAAAGPGVAGEEGEVEPVDEDANRMVRMWNISYQTTESTLREVFGRFGEVEELQLIMDRETGRFKGVAVVTYKNVKFAASALRTLNDKMIDGRPVRLEYHISNRRKSGGNNPDSRYFLIDRSLKCSRCGAEGHAKKFCPESTKIKPCHICGALNAHDPNRCPDLVSEDLPAATLCLECGGIDHHTEHCQNVLQGASFLDDGPVRCLRCGMIGHINCGRDTRRRSGGGSFDYCYRCGSSHHLAQTCGNDGSGGVSRRHTFGGGTHIRYGDDSHSPPTSSTRGEGGHGRYSSEQSYDHRSQQRSGGDRGPVNYPPPPTGPPPSPIRGGGPRQDAYGVIARPVFPAAAPPPPPPPPPPLPPPHMLPPPPSTVYPATFSPPPPPPPVVPQQHFSAGPGPPPPPYRDQHPPAPLLQSPYPIPPYHEQQHMSRPPPMYDQRGYDEPRRHSRG